MIWYCLILRWYASITIHQLLVWDRTWMRINWDRLPHVDHLVKPKCTLACGRCERWIPITQFSASDSDVFLRKCNQNTNLAREGKWYHVSSKMLRLHLVWIWGTVFVQEHNILPLWLCVFPCWGGEIGEEQALQQPSRHKLGDAPLHHLTLRNALPWSRSRCFFSAADSKFSGKNLDPAAKEANVPSKLRGLPKRKTSCNQETERPGRGENRDKYWLWRIARSGFKCCMLLCKWTSLYLLHQVHKVEPLCNFEFMSLLRSSKRIQYRIEALKTSERLIEGRDIKVTMITELIWEWTSDL